MKKITITFLSLLLIFSSFPLSGFAENNIKSEDTSPEELEKYFKDVQDALSKTEIAIDLSDNEPIEKVEEIVYNEDGEVLGTFGVEEIEEPNSPNEISPMGVVLKGQTKTFKVYWYAAFVNYQFYMKVKRNTNGKGSVVSAYDESYLVIPPGVVRNDYISITRKNETDSSPAEARYNLDMSAPVSTKLYIYGRLKAGVFYSGGN